jgi:renalase
MAASSQVTACDVLIVGAGIAGLTAAKHLRAAGQNVLVLEKSRGLGGRAATRRWDGMPVDHGAQFFTARSPAFKEQVQDWLDRGVCFEWTRGLHRATKDGPKAPEDDSFPRYACREGMNSLGRDLAGPDPSFVLRESKVTTINRHASAWQLQTEDGRTFTSRALLVTAPPPQAAALLEKAAPAAVAKLAATPMSPCLALAARYPRREFPWRGIQAPNHAVVSWIGHDTSKRPDLHPEATVLMIHASPNFSQDNFDTEESVVSKYLLEAASEIAGSDLTTPESTFLQRWRYALGADGGSDDALLFPDEAPLVLAGDAIAGGKIEGAWLSGRAAAKNLLA